VIVSSGCSSGRTSARTRSCSWFEGIGHGLRFLHNGELKCSHVYRDDQAWQGASIAMKAELEVKGWMDPGRLEWGR